jgi:glycosyltransferase involved in cell wall biosynthesis
MIDYHGKVIDVAGMGCFLRSWQRGGIVFFMFDQKTEKANFSVSMSVYKNDKPEFFRQALDSIINQTLPPSEIVLVVDGPVPSEITKVVKEYETKYGYFKTIWIEKNVGHGNARRIGLDNCTYDIVALMDSDDISVPDRFEKQRKCFEEDNKLSIVGGYIQEFIENVENVVGTRIVPLLDAEIKEYIKSRCPMNQVSVMFKKQDVMKSGGYLKWYCDEDYYLWIRMCLRGCKFKNLSDNLVNVRGGTEMYRRRGGWKYFKSEAKLQSYMLNKKMIGFSKYFFNVVIRLVVQVLMPNRMRGYVFSKLFRKVKI